MVVIEAMAAGTPVIAFGCGSVPEIIEDGLTGLIVSDVDDAAASVPVAANLDRRVIRQRFESRFTAERMARDYLTYYQLLLNGEAGMFEIGMEGAQRTEAAD